MSAATEPSTDANSTLTVEEILRRYPADPRLMSSPEGDKRGLDELRRAAEERQQS